MEDRVSHPTPVYDGEMRQAAKSEEHQIAVDARKGGVPAYEFRADASPAEKAAIVKQSIPPGLDPSNSKAKVKSALSAATSTAVVSDLDTGPPTAGTPTLVINGGKNGVTNGSSNGTTATANGDLKPSDTPGKSPMVNGFPKAGDGEWERTGWAPRFGNLNDELGITENGTTDHQTYLESQLDDKFFGEWWHNAGIIAFACLSTWIMTKLGGGLAMICIIGATCATYYRTSIRRVRRNVRDDISREMAKTKISTDVETLEWINSFTVKFWPIYQPVLAATVINIVDKILAGATPGFLDSIKLSTFTLGTKPPRIDHVKTYPKTEDDIVEMDWAFSFTPNDTDDLTSRQLKNKINPKIVLEVRVGKGIASKGIPIILEDMAFSGTMKVKIKLQTNFPHIEKVDICFLGRPVFDYALKPLGGETFGFDIGFLPGLSGFIQEMIHGNLQPMLYAPNVLTLEIAKMMGGAPIESAIGILAVTIHRAHGIKNSDKFSGAPDPYTVISIDQRAELARTKKIEGSSDPKWNETKYIVVSNLNDNLTLQVFDYNDVRKDKELGVASFPLSTLQENAQQENLTVPIMSNGKPKGQMMFDVRFFPVLEAPTLEDGTKGPLPESNSGILRYTVSQAKDLDSSLSMIDKLSTYCQMMLNNSPVLTTKVVKRNNEPIWDESVEIFVADKKSCTLGVVLKDERGFANDPVVGQYGTKLTALLENNVKGTEWFNLTGVKSGRVKLTAQWKPVTVKGIVGTGGYVTPIGVMRLHFQSAKELRNVEAVGKSDPYARVLLSGIQKARTVTYENDLNPTWDEVLYVPVHSDKEKLRLEVMDQESMGKDKSLGAYELSLGEFIKADSQGLYKVHDEKRNRSEGLVLDGKGAPKGTLNFTAAFYPCMNIVDPEDEEEAEEAENNQTEKSQSSKEGAKAVEGGQVIEDPKIPPGSSQNATSDADTAEMKHPKIKLSPEQLLRHDSGLIIFNIADGQLSHNDCYLEVLMDDMLFPAFSSTKIRSKNVKLNEIGDAMVRELEFSEITLRLREHGEDGEDAVLAKLRGSTLETLKQCLYKPTVLTLKSNNGEISKVNVSLKYIPILMKLDPSESISNMGTLRVEILDAANLPSADRNGKSDPYCLFEIEGKEIHKTKVQKKTLHPTWNEVFEVKIPSRTAANFTTTVFDWDLASKGDFLAQTQIDLKPLTPFTPQTFHYRLKGKKGEDGNFGELRLRMVFKPDYITRSRVGSSTFQGTFAASGKLVTGVAVAPLKVGGLAVGGVSKGASFLKKNTFGRKSRDSGPADEDFVPEVTAQNPVRPSTDGREEFLQTPVRPPRGSSLSPSSAGNGTTHARSRSSSSQHSVAGVIGAGPESGIATVRLVSASGFPTGANVQVRIKTADKNKDVFKSKSVKSSSGDVHWDETFTCQCFADQQFKVFVKDNHIFKDEELGEGLFVVDDTGSGQDTVVNVGAGRVTLKTGFQVSENAADSSPKSSRRGLLKR